jgi:hypothetical protein
VYHAIPRQGAWIRKEVINMVGVGVSEVYVVRFYSGAQCITNQQLSADTMDNAIAMVLRDTVERYDDGLTHVDACPAHGVYGGISMERTQYEVKYVDIFTVVINGITYTTKWWDLE